MLRCVPAAPAPQHTLGSIGLGATLPEFSPCPLYAGGDVGDNELHMLHTYTHLPHSLEIVKVV